MRSLSVYGACLSGLLLLVFGITPAEAQHPDYRVVFDLTSRDSTDQSIVIRWINEITGSDKDALLEVVLYGQSLDMVLKDKSLVRDRLEKLFENKNVSFKVCAIALRNHHIETNELLPGVGIVPDGIYEIISKQKQGWGYIKAGH